MKLKEYSIDDRQALILSDSVVEAVRLANLVSLLHQFIKLEDSF